MEDRGTGTTRGITHRADTSSPASLRECPWVRHGTYRHRVSGEPIGPGMDRVPSAAVFTSIEVANQVPWLKMMLVGTHAERAGIRKEIREENRAVFSSPVFLEILPKQASKESMLSYLQDTMFPNRTCCAIGDYYNDIELFQETGVSAVIEELKRIATSIVSDNNHGAVADFIDTLRYILWLTAVV